MSAVAGQLLGALLGCALFVGIHLLYELIGALASRRAGKRAPAVSTGTGIATFRDFVASTGPAIITGQKEPTS